MGNIVWNAEQGWHDGPPASVSLDQAGRLVITPAIEVQTLDLLPGDLLTESPDDVAELVVRVRYEGLPCDRAKVDVLRTVPNRTNDCGPKPAWFWARVAHVHQVIR